VVDEERVSAHLAAVEQRRGHELAEVEEAEAHEVVAEADEGRGGGLVGEQEAEHEGVGEQAAAPVDLQIDEAGEGRVGEQVD